MVIILTINGHLLQIIFKSFKHHLFNGGKIPFLTTNTKMISLSNKSSYLRLSLLLIVLATAQGSLATDLDYCTSGKCIACSQKFVPNFTGKLYSCMQCANSSLVAVTNRPSALPSSYTESIYECQGTSHSIANCELSATLTNGNSYPTQPTCYLCKKGYTKQTTANGDTCVERTPANGIAFDQISLIGGVICDEGYQMKNGQCTQG
jgi:hypothetical protein